MVVCVINRSNQCPSLLREWTKAGAPGVTIVESSGVKQHERGVLDDIPLFPSLRDLEEADEWHHRTVFTVVPDEETVDRVVQATEALLGDMCNPDTGILFVVPVSRVIGMNVAADCE
jgi:nitrogen regulatory protein PII